MQTIVERLKSGERWWAAEAVARLVALVLVALTALCARVLRAGVQTQPGPARLPAACAPSHFLLAVAGFAALVGGLALLIEGPGLFRLVAYPRRRLF